MFEIDNRYLLYLCGVKDECHQYKEIMEKKDPIEEARRYVANAEEVIEKADYDPELKRLCTMCSVD